MYEVWADKCVNSGTTEPILRCAKGILNITAMGSVEDFVVEARQQQCLQWRDKALYGEFLKKVDNGGELSLSFQWLKCGHLNVH